MKKLFTIFTIVLSSFFFCSINVKADEFSINIDSSEFDLLNEEFYQLRENSIEFCENNNKFYIIGYDTSNTLVSYIFDKDIIIDVYINNNFGSTKQLKIIFDGSYDAYQIKNNTLTKAYSGTNFNVTIASYGNYYGFKYFLDSNYNIATTYSSGDMNSPLTITYGDYSYTYEIYTPFPSLYDIYTNTQVEEDIHAEEKEILSNFYSLIIEKISYLATSIASNYIYLSVFVVLILIFVIELVLRRLI